MKKIIIILMLVLSINNNTLYPQSVSKYILFTENIDLFNGTWEYTSGNEIFRIVLKMGVDETVLNSAPCLIGDYFYSKSGFVMDNYNELNLPTTYDKDTKNSIIIFASNGNTRADWVRPYNLYVFFRDKRTKTWTGNGSIELISPTQIHWVLKKEEGVYINDDPDNGFSVPTDVIMNKK